MLKSLNRLPDEHGDERLHLIKAYWDKYFGDSTDETFVQFALDVYFKAAQHYLMHFSGTPLRHIAQSLGKRWLTTLKHCGMGFFPLEHFIAGIYLSKTLPLEIHETMNGGKIVVPTVVMQTYWKRHAAGVAQPDLLQIMLGKAIGPRLSEFGRRVLLEPWNAAAITAEFDKRVTDAQKIDSEPKPVKFGETSLPISNEDTSVTESSTPEPAP